jgi:hypothetical protein
MDSKEDVRRGFIDQVQTNLKFFSKREQKNDAEDKGS